MAESALEKINEHNNRIMKRNKLMKRTLFTACSFFLVALVGMNMLHQSGNKIPPIVNHPIEKPGNEVTEDLRLLVFINEIESKMTASKLNYETDYYTIDSFTEEEMVKYLGKDLRNLTFPNQEGNWKYQSRDGYEVVYEKESGNIANDWSYYNYVREDNRKLLIRAGKVMMPYDCEYMYGSDPKETSFKTATGGMRIVIGGTQRENTMSEVQVADNDLYEFLVADFEYDGIYYRVEAENIKGQEFHEIIESILCIE